MMEYDQPLVWVTLLLMLFGMVMVYSASIALPDSPKYANYKHTHFLQRQAIFIAAALMAGLFVFRVKIEVWQRWASVLFVGSLVMLLLVFIPGIGFSVNGAQRWLNLRVFNLQPSEVMKIAAVLYAADYTVRKQEYMHKLTKGFLPMAKRDRPGGPAAADGARPGRLRRDRLHRDGHSVPGRDQRDLVRRDRRAAGDDLRDHHLALAVPPRACSPTSTRGRKTMHWARLTS
ncbi:FtsW/RodA/SpoVE family cell cycle protein [Massilia sp. B-10]|nr:FtsW/RodA/SpoVE family cell cycle protein [Massilia sp. B-10]